MRIDYSTVTEIPDNYISFEELRMIYCRYHTASRFVAGKRVLEAGCGPGLGLGYLLGKGAKMILGGDCTELNIKCAKNTYQDSADIIFLLLDAHQLPFRQNSFDVILLFEVIFYLSQPECFFSECVRVLNKDGLIILCLPNRLVPGFQPSPFSTGYYNSLELYRLLKTYFNNVKIFGAFPVKGSLSIQRIISFVRLIAAKILNLTGIGKAIKERLKKPVFGRNIILPSTIQENLCSEEPLVKINSGSLDNRYRILYGIARRN